jgi:class 3 adenylate cyclase/tetratricopeptide (TPR) repeat protein
LGTVAPASTVRKTVSVLFCDVAGSTSLAERLDPEALREVMTRYYELAQTVVERHGGTVEKFIGDAVVAVFGVPVAHEDDALRAVGAADEIRREVFRYSAELWHRRGTTFEVRIGVNTGEVVVGDVSAGSSFVSGDVVNVAARLEQSAAAGEIRVGEETLRLVRDAVAAEPLELDLRGKSAPVAAYRLVEVRGGVPGVARRMGAPLVGRAQELDALRQAVARAVNEMSCQLVTVVGPAGVGKSRIAVQLAAEAEDEMTVLRGRCLPYGEGITFWPVAEVIRQAAGITDDDSSEEVRSKIALLVEDDDDAPLIRERISGVVGVDEHPSDQQETFWALRRFFERLAARKPLLIVVDDIQWAEESFLEFIEYVADFVEARPIALVCLARPDLLETRPDWGAGTSSAELVSLAPLGADHARRLIENLLGAAVEDAASALVVERAGGNPLFMEEVVRTLVERGELQRADGHWELATAAVDLSLPPTIAALLGARLDRLRAEERNALQRASVVGEVFWWRAVAHLSDESGRARVGSALRGLVTKQLIRPERSTLAGQDAFSFSHILVRDAAYNSLAKRVRADLHTRLARWMEATIGERIGEYEEILAYHLEQAYRLGEEVGLPSPELMELAIAAAERLERGGNRALQRGDARAAANLLRRSVAVGEGNAGRRPRLLVTLATALSYLGELEAAEETFSAALEAADGQSDDVAAAHASLGRGEVRMELDPEGATADAAAEVERVLPVLREAGDDAGLARAWNVMCTVHNMWGQWGPDEEAARRALHHARRARDRAQEATALLNLGVAMIFGPRPAAEAEPRFDELLADTEHNRFATASLLAGRSHARALRGNFDEARRDAATARHHLREVGMDVQVAAWTMGLSEVERLADNLEAVEEQLRWACDELQKAGALGYLSTTAAMCARVLFDRGARDHEVEHFLDIADASGSSDDSATQVIVNSTRARLLARAGRTDDARVLAREAVALVEQTDSLVEHAEALLVLAEVEDRAAHREEAKALRLRALELFEAKGAVPSSARVRALLEAPNGQ